jgi:hypothetical protein
MSRDVELNLGHIAFRDWTEPVTAIVGRSQQIGDAAMSSLKTIVLAAALFLSALCPAYAGLTPALHFHSEQEAKQHCPNDAIVWVNTKTRVYHLKGERWYGVTKNGVYVCRKEADAEGDRMTRNGQ